MHLNGLAGVAQGGGGGGGGGSNPTFVTGGICDL